MQDRFSHVTVRNFSPWTGSSVGTQGADVELGFQKDRVTEPHRNHWLLKIPELAGSVGG